MTSDSIIIPAVEGCGIRSIEGALIPGRAYIEGGIVEVTLRMRLGALGHGRKYRAVSTCESFLLYHTYCSR